MKYKLEDYKAIADDLISADHDRDEKFRDVDAAHNVSWEKPAEWDGVGWLRAYPTTKPADLIDAAVRALSTKSPQLSITPLLPNDVTKQQFDLIERGLMWHWKQIERRAQYNPTKKIVQSAIKYDEVCAQVVYLPYQKKILDVMQSKAAKRMKSYGPFSIIVHDPINVHTQYSDLGPERVLLCRRQPYHKVIDFWGKNADELKKAVTGKDGTGLTEMCDVYDFWDSEFRCVWVEPVSGEGEDTILLEPQEHGLGFLPWSCRVGDEERRPLLNSVINGNIINTTNLFRSLMISLAMARAAEPTKVSSTPTGDGVEVDATEPLATYNVKQGETLTAIPAGEIGQSIQKIYDMLGGEMDQGTGMSLLMQNNAPSGMAFATYNAVIQAGMGAINPQKQIAERCIADVFGIMVAYLRDSGDSLISYDDRNKNLSAEGVPTLGTQEVITSDMLPELENFYAEVKLTEYVPSDDMGKANAATMLTQQLKLPVKRAMEMMDIADPQTALEEWAEEQEFFNSVQLKNQDVAFDMQLLQQRKLAKMQAELQAGQGQDGQPGGPPPGEPGSQLPSGPQNPALENGFAGIEGQGFNGAMGGSSPLAAAPEMTGVGLPQLEGRDNRGLRLPPEGREPVE